MSLLAFQRALADLAASPELCLRVRADADAALAGYDLTPVEHRRVASAAAQRGMVVNCQLHRSNRISTILTLLPGTVHLLKAVLRETADRFWAEYPVPDFTTRREIRRFSTWLVREVAAGRIDSPFLAEVTSWELAMYELGMVAPRRTREKVAADAERWPDGPLALHPLVRVAAFRHDPAALIPRVLRKEPLPWDGVPEGEFYLLLDMREGRQVLPLDEVIGPVLFAAQRGEPVPAEHLDELLEEGLLVRTAPVEEPALAGAA